MRVYDIIAKKRDGFENTPEELAFLVNHYVQGDLSHEQMSAWLMAVYFQGMTPQETADLTTLMMNSGKILDLSSINGVVVDKHSTGGVGDKTTLIMAPIVAAGGVPMAKLSGSGLGFTGGTIDKLTAIAGFTVRLSTQAFIQQVNKIGLAVIGQTDNLVPADKKIYALRDITATIESVPLIASSIMSKKLAAGAQKILLDVKYGSGAFMQTPEKATALAKAMVGIGNNLGRQTVAIITNMEEPLGFAVGNALEVIEAIETLENRGPRDLTKLCLTLAGHIFYLVGKTATVVEGEALAKSLLVSGAAYSKFEEWIQTQGGSPLALRSPRQLLQASQTLAMVSRQEGYIGALDAKKIGQYSMMLGAGRQRIEDTIDLSAGIILSSKRGDYVKKGDTLATLYFNADHQEAAQEISQSFEKAYQFSTLPREEASLILKTITQ